MKRIYTITFHASYNYGSNLQAYALQEYVKKITKNNCDYKIINLRKKEQKELYENFFEKKGWKNFVKKILFHKEKQSLQLKQQYFETFINKYLNITQEYESMEEFPENILNGDYYISGSDQIWNLQANDFDWANYLEFVKSGRKISYAASFGPKDQKWNLNEKERVTNDLLQYDFLSVREQGSFNNVKKLTNITPQINIDPTMLLKKEDWIRIIDDKPILNEKYILLYYLKYTEEICEIAQEVSKILKMPVYITRLEGFKENRYRFNKKLDVGPLEFLNILNNASLVLSSSFHGTVFSILLNKPFFAINGSKDYRINTLLEKTDLKNRTIEKNNILTRCNDAFNIEFTKSENKIIEERNKSENFLKKALDIK